VLDVNEALSTNTLTLPWNNQLIRRSDFIPSKERQKEKKKIERNLRLIQNFSWNRTDKKS
jgi:hypothetical protein